MQVTYQIKILTTALFSVSMLQKKLTILQWLALTLLATGVGVVQLQVYELRPTNSNVSVSNAPAEVRHQSALLGLVCILASCVMSGFAGVYFEKLLKHTPPSIFLRNVQLGVIGVVFGIAAALFSDGPKVSCSVIYCIETSAEKKLELCSSNASTVLPNIFIVLTLMTWRSPEFRLGIHLKSLGNMRAGSRDT
jgi:UDP-galactose transporter